MPRTVIWSTCAIFAPVSSHWWFQTIKGAIQTGNTTLWAANDEVDVTSAVRQPRTVEKKIAVGDVNNPSLMAACSVLSLSPDWSQHLQSRAERVIAAVLTSDQPTAAEVRWGERARGGKTTDHIYNSFFEAWWCVNWSHHVNAEKSSILSAVYLALLPLLMSSLREWLCTDEWTGIKRQLLEWSNICL